MLFAQISAPLLYLATALCMVVVARRWSSLRLSVALVLVFLPLLLTGRALLTGRVYGPIDLAYQGQPFAAVAADLGVGEAPPASLHDLYTMIIPGRRAVRYAWSNGEWPLWNPFILCGQVLAGGGQAAPFYPPHLVALLLPLPLALGYVAAVNFFLAALGAFLFARDLGCREGAALLAGVGWMAMNGTVFWISWPLGMTMVLLPLVLLGVRSLVRTPSWHSCLLLTAPLALGLLAGHPETSVHHVWVGGAWGLWELARRPLRAWWPVLAWSGATGLLTIGITAIFIFPLLDGLSQSFEWHLRHAALASEAGSWAVVVGHLVGNLIPFVHETTRGTGLFSTALPGSYVGSLLFAPAAYGLWRSPRWERWPLVVFAGIGLMIGARAPGIYRALEALPLLDRTINDRLVAVSGLALAVLAALGLDAWTEADRPRGLGLAVLAAIAALGTLVYLMWSPLRTQGLASVSLVTQTVLLLAPLVLCLPFLFKANWGKLAPGALMALLIVQRLTEIGGYYPVSPVERFYPPISPLDSVLLEGGISRIVGVGGTLLPNQGTHYRLEDIRGYDAVHLLRFPAVERLWTTGRTLWFGRVTDLTNPMISFLNVRWAVVPNRTQPGRGWSLVRAGPTVGLWRNHRVLERAFLPRRVRMNDRPKRILDAMGRATDFQELAWIEISPGSARLGNSIANARRPVEEYLNGRGVTTLTRDGLGYQLEAQLDSPAWVVISDAAWRGWRARIGRHELPVARANFAFLALHLPEGRHRVELFFRPRSFEIGLGVTVMTLVGLLAAGLWWRLRRSTLLPRLTRQT